MKRPDWLESRIQKPLAPSWVLGICLVALAGVACEDDTVSGPSEPDHLAFSVQPMSVGVGDPVAPTIVVVVRDKNGGTIWEWVAPVTLSLESDGRPATLRGTTTVSAVGGTAIFQDLHVEGPGSGYRLVAASEGLDEGTSEPFAVNELFLSSVLAAGRTHTCALDEAGAAFCWGENQEGQLGDGTTTGKVRPTPVDTELRFVSLTSGSSHTCGLTEAGGVYCWGRNEEGELGTPTTELCAWEGGPASACSTNPVQVSEAMVWKQIGAGYSHTCGLTFSNEMYCWGENVYGQVGDGTSAERGVPTPVNGEHQFDQIAVGYLHSCGLTAGGQAYCWGSNIYGEVGDGTHSSRHEPTAVSGDHNFVTIAAGGGPCHGHTCATTTAGTTYCWGRNYQRHLQPDTEILLYAPVPLVDDPGLVTISIGGYALCGLRGDGALFCWGQGTYGSIGHGEPSDQEVPRAIRSDLRFSSVATGQYHTCAVTFDGESYCWGRNTDGQLGNQSNPLGWMLPVTVWGF